MKVLLKLHSLRIMHLLIQSELKSLIRVKMACLPGPGFQVGTGPNETVWVIHAVNPIPTVQFRFQTQSGTVLADWNRC